MFRVAISAGMGQKWPFTCGFAGIFDDWRPAGRKGRFQASEGALGKIIFRIGPFRATLVSTALLPAALVPKP